MVQCASNATKMGFKRRKHNYVGVYNILQPHLAKKELVSSPPPI